MEEVRRLIAGNLVNQRNQAVAEVPGNVVLGVYFSASWCPPCRQFTPMLGRYYEEANRHGKRLEIVFVSSDRSEFDFANYFQQHHGPWLAVKFQAAQLRERLGSHFGVRGIPAFFIEGQEARSQVASGDLSLIDRLARVEISVDAEARDLLIKVAENIVKHFTEEKFKVLKKSSEKLQSALLSKPQGAKPLLDLGFVDEGESFRFTGSIDALIGKMNRLKATTPTPAPQTIASTADAVEEPKSETLVEIFSSEGKCELPIVLEDFQVFKALVESVIDISDPILLAVTATGTLPLQSAEDLATLEILSRNSGRATVYALKFSDERAFATDEDALENSRRLSSKLSEISKPETSRFVSVFPIVHLYEIPRAQRKALELVPIGKIFPDVSETLEVDFVAALARWFKADFFKWMDKPRCATCNGSTQISGTGTATGQERTVGLAANVEIYCCTVCGNTTRFPRYNNPEILLNTRTGRCGEFANAFGLFCRALGFDTRKVFPIDGDHVWIEIYLEKLGRWVHVDPCEAAVDQALLYESGWGRKYSRVVGISRRECVDVTKRYVVDLNSKPVFDQTDLAEIDRVARAFYIETRASDQAKVATLMDERLAFEGSEISRDAKSSEAVGRTTGSAEWRANRGELGSSKKTQILKKQQELVDAGMDPVLAAIEALKLV